MTAAGDERPSVLIVDDEERVAQAFELWLGDGYRIDAAFGGKEALERIDETVDIVLLDRHMPGMSGETVLERIEAGPYDPFVVMVTAVDPDVDIVGMPFDEYVSKPVDGAVLRDVVDRLSGLPAYGSRARELHAVTGKLAALEAEKTNAELKSIERYTELSERRDRLLGELDREALPPWLLDEA